jgi:hypothetical protein
MSALRRMNTRTTYQPMATDRPIMLHQPWPQGPGRTTRPTTRRELQLLTIRKRETMTQDNESVAREQDANQKQGCKNARSTPTRRAKKAATTTLGDDVRVGIYVRRSTDDENQPYSIEAQGTRLTAYVDSQPGCNAT